MANAAMHTMESLLNILCNTLGGVLEKIYIEKHGPLAMGLALKTVILSLQLFLEWESEEFRG